MKAGDHRIYTQQKGRIIGLDLLRSIAIFLTLCRHSLQPTNILWKIGWSGVYMFFVLSSFLITNILFTEYYKTGKINFFRFFIRRALKIYPLYYLFILISVYKNRALFLSSHHYKMQLAGQIFHVQNYTDILWYHTWSLAAEEHFYLGICVLLSAYIFFLKPAGLKNFVWLFIAVIVSVPFLRYFGTILYHIDWFMGTHYIMDSFAFGSMLAFCKFVWPKTFSGIIYLMHYLLIPIAVLLLPLYLLPADNALMNPVGITMMLTAFTLILAYLISTEDFARKINIVTLTVIRPLASIGIASYSIYLFHVPVKSVIDSIGVNEWLRIPVYFIACIVVGK